MVTFLYVYDTLSLGAYDLVADLVSTYQITDENRMVKGAQ